MTFCHGLKEYNTGDEMLDDAQLKIFAAYFLWEEGMRRTGSTWCIASSESEHFLEDLKLNDEAMQGIIWAYEDKRGDLYEYRESSEEIKAALWILSKEYDRGDAYNPYRRALDDVDNIILMREVLKWDFALLRILAHATYYPNCNLNCEKKCEIHCGNMCDEECDTHEDPGPEDDAGEPQCGEDTVT